MAYSDENNFYHSVGLRNVGSYQISGHPYVTGSTGFSGTTEITVSFPYVSQKFTVKNTQTSGWRTIRVRFDAESQMANDSHYISIAMGESCTFDVKATKVYIKGYNSAINNYKYELYASLTNIPEGRMFDLTGSGITE